MTSDVVRNPSNKVEKSITLLNIRRRFVPQFVPHQNTLEWISIYISVTWGYSGRLNGAQGRTRTTDTRIFSPLLYQLSYLGTARPRAFARS